MIKILRSIPKGAISKSFSSAKPLSLYTWGMKSCGLGYEHDDPGTVKTDYYHPKKVATLDGKIKKAAMGCNHTAVISSSLFLVNPKPMEISIPVATISMELLDTKQRKLIKKNQKW